MKQLASAINVSLAQRTITLISEKQYTVSMHFGIVYIVRAGPEQNDYDFIYMVSKIAINIKGGKNDANISKEPGKVAL